MYKMAKQYIKFPKHLNSIYSQSRDSVFQLTNIKRFGKMSSNQQRLMSDWANAQSDLNFSCLHMLSHPLPLPSLREQH